jgi:hypothetical protein
VGLGDEVRLQAHCIEVLLRSGTAADEEGEHLSIRAGFEEGVGALAAENFDVFDGGGVGGEEARGETGGFSAESLREAQDRDRTVQATRIDQNIGARRVFHARILSRR